MEKGIYSLKSGAQVARTVKKTSRQKQVKGMIANPGRTTGSVKIVSNLSHLNKVKSGDILVAVKTIPQFVPAMIRSAGIITDLGGMLSHAAIISREFGIPCIVGTKKATKIFTDNDTIELNAYDGTARKI